MVGATAAAAAAAVARQRYSRRRSHLWEPGALAARARRSPARAEPRRRRTVRARSVAVGSNRLRVVWARNDVVCGFRSARSGNTAAAARPRHREAGGRTMSNPWFHRIDTGGTLGRMRAMDHSHSSSGILSALGTYDNLPPPGWVVCKLNCLCVFFTCRLPNRCTSHWNSWSSLTLKLHYFNLLRISCGFVMQFAVWLFAMLWTCCGLAACMDLLWICSTTSCKSNRSCGIWALEMLQSHGYVSAHCRRYFFQTFVSKQEYTCNSKAQGSGHLQAPRQNLLVSIVGSRL